MYQYLRYQQDNAVVTITLNRPEAYNALNNGIKLELQDAFQRLQDDASVRVVVLTGAGKAFCSGQDLKAAQTELQGQAYSESIRKYYNPLILAMRQLEKPIIGRLNGMAVGAGCSLILACDLIVAAEQAYLSELFVGIGLVMDSGSTYFLPRMVGSQKAFELATMGTKVSATDAMALGLVNQVVPAEQLDEATQRYVQYYAHAPSVAVGLIKKMLNQATQLSLEETLELEAVHQDTAAQTQDHQEGVQAFLEKRAPTFIGS